MSAENSSPTPDWAGLAARPAFQQLLKTKASFVRKACVFYLAYYFALLVLVGYFPDLMKQKVWGNLNWAYLFALSQFIMTWVMAFIYVRKASSWDKESKAVLEGK